MNVIEKIDGAGYWNRTNNERLETFSFTIKLIPQIWSGGLLCTDNIRGYLTSYYYTPHITFLSFAWHKFYQAYQAILFWLMFYPMMEYC